MDLPINFPDETYSQLVSIAELPIRILISLWLTLTPYLQLELLYRGSVLEIIRDVIVAMTAAVFSKKGFRRARTGRRWLIRWRGTREIGRVAVWD